MEDTPRALREIHRTLKPQGRLVLSEPCNDSVVLRTIRWFWYRLPHKFSVHHKAFRSRELLRLLADAEMRVLQAEPFGYVAFPVVGMVDFLPVLRYLPGKRLLTDLDEFLERVPILRRHSWHLIVVTTPR